MQRVSLGPSSHLFVFLGGAPGVILEFVSPTLSVALPSNVIAFALHAFLKIIPTPPCDSWRDGQDDVSSPLPHKEKHVFTVTLDCDPK